jgi:hypothetical protein
MQVSHLAFADESHWNKGRFRSLGLVTLCNANGTSFSEELQRLLQESCVKEFKWERLRDAKHRFAALKLGEFAVNQAVRGTLRLDVLTWDIEDRRHRVRGRDDVQNLGRMYYHLFKYVLRERWPDGSTWCLHPDEHTSIDWPNIEEFLRRSSMRAKPFQDMFSDGKIRIGFKIEFKIEEICPVKSSEHPLIQLADLFAGLATFSREHYLGFAAWQKASGLQGRFAFEDETEATKISGADRERFQVLEKLDALCKRHRLGVSLRTHRGFRTLNPAYPVNFWWYEPQSPEDKAPTKTRR